VPDGPPSLKMHLRGLREGGEPEIHERVDLRAWTALGVGGLADLLVRCRSADGLQRAIDLLAAHGRSWLVLGAGSRMVPPDSGLRVPVLNLSGNLGLWELDLDGAVAGGGANLAQVCRAAARTGLPGMEALMATSSSLGGAIHAAHHGHIPLGGMLDWVELARPGAPTERIYPRFKGKDNPGLGLDLTRRVILRARLQLAGDGTSGFPTRVEGVGRARIHRLPRSTSPFFIGPPGSRAETVLAEAGCVGMAVGGARVSRKYPNRISTSRATRTADVVQLTREVQQLAAERTGVVLQPALCFVDENGVAVEL
jgi:UDP-N-acetylmuramate dehydrogenase